jgi:acyl-CoA synthetase (NDP forming)
MPPLVLWFIGTAALLLVSGCAQVQIQDETVYGLKGPGYGAVLAHTLSSPVTDLTETQWEQTQVNIMNSGKAVLCMSSDSFADWKSAIEILCSQGNYCTYPVQQQVTRLFSKLEYIAKRARRVP